MAISKAKKKEIVDEVSEALKKSKMTVLVDYKGLSVKESQDLRKQLKEENVGYKVAKNTLVKIAIKDIDELKDIDPAMFSGPVGLAFGFEDEVAPVKGLVEFAKEHEDLGVLAAFNASGEVFDKEQVDALAKLPSKEQLQAQVVGTIAAPLTGFVGVMEGNIRNLVNVLNNMQEQKAEA